MTIGDKLKFARKKMFLSQEAMAKELGVSFVSYNRWENGKYAPNYEAQRAFHEFCVKNNIHIRPVINSLHNIKQARFESITEFYVKQIARRKENKFACVEIKKILKNLPFYEKNMQTANDEYYFDKDTQEKINQLYLTLQSISEYKQETSIKYMKICNSIADAKHYGDNAIELKEHKKYYDDYKSKIVQFIYKAIVKFRKSTKNCLFTRGELFTLNNIINLVFGEEKGSKAGYVFIDEVQNLYKIELEKIMGTVTTRLNVFGDIRQKLEKSFGIEKLDKNLLSFAGETKFFELNENYRSTEEITEYINKHLNIEPQITSMGNSGEQVVENFDLDKIEAEIRTLLNNSNKTRIAILVSKDNERSDIKQLMANETCNNFLYTVNEAKGIEYDAVFVIPHKMTDNEKYIAYSRALSRLWITK